MREIHLSKSWRLLVILISVTSLLVVAPVSVYAQDQLPSWNDGPAKTSILEFVASVTNRNGPDYVKPQARIATFDNDGTLWLEYPMYTQLLFAMDRVKEMAPKNPKWKTTQPFKAALEGDMKALGTSGMQGVMEIMMATHAGMTAGEFAADAERWLATTRNERFDRPYMDLVYQPMLELLDYLRENEFKTFIVSGGGMAFMRPITDRVYGIPPEQVVGSSIVAEYQVIEGKGTIVRKPKIGFIDDKEGKPVGIYQHIGQRPILAFGNSDGDMQMIEYTTTGNGRRLGLYLHHTDAEREYAYDRDSHVGKFDVALDRADEEGWIVVSMKDDWAKVWTE